MLQDVQGDYILKKDGMLSWSPPPECDYNAWYSHPPAAPPHGTTTVSSSSRSDTADGVSSTLGFPSLSSTPCCVPEMAKVILPHVTCSYCPTTEYPHEDIDSQPDAAPMIVSPLPRTPSTLLTMVPEIKTPPPSTVRTDEKKGTDNKKPDGKTERSSVGQLRPKKKSGKNRKSKLTDELYYPECILDVRGPPFQYLVMWQGFEKNQATWEPAENFTHDPMISTLVTECLERKAKKYFLGRLHSYFTL